MECHELRKELLTLAIYEENELKGHACVIEQFGAVWLIDLEYWGDDKYQVARAFLKARKWLKDQGISEFYTDVTNPDLVDFYRKRGFTVERVIMKGDI